MRVNARLDDETAEPIDYLTRATGEGVSHVLRESLALYCGRMRTQRGGPAHLGALVGNGDGGRNDIASDVKRRLGDSLERKTGRGKR